MPQTILETPCYLFKLYYDMEDSENMCLTHKPSKRSIMLTSDETESFLHDYANWHKSMEPHYLAGMLWEAHAAPILAEIDMEGFKEMTQEEINAKILEAFKAGFDAGFDASAEGFNGECWSRNYSEEDYTEAKARAVANFQDETEGNK